jgi:SNF2-related domain
LFPPGPPPPFFFAGTFPFASLTHFLLGSQKTYRCGWGCFCSAEHRDHAMTTHFESGRCIPPPAEVADPRRYELVIPRHGTDFVGERDLVSPAEYELLQLDPPQHDYRAAFAGLSAPTHSVWNVIKKHKLNHRLQLVIAVAHDDECHARTHDPGARCGGHAKYVFGEPRGCGCPPRRPFQMKVRSRDGVIDVTSNGQLMDALSTCLQQAANSISAPNRVEARVLVHKETVSRVPTGAAQSRDCDAVGSISMRLKTVSRRDVDAMALKKAPLAAELKIHPEALSGVSREDELVLVKQVHSFEQISLSSVTPSDFLQEATAGVTREETRTQARMLLLLAQRQPNDGAAPSAAGSGSGSGSSWASSLISSAVGSIRTAFTTKDDLARDLSNAFFEGASPAAVAARRDTIVVSGEFGNVNHCLLANLSHLGAESSMMHQIRLVDASRECVSIHISLFVNPALVDEAISQDTARQEGRNVSTQKDVDLKNVIEHLQCAKSVSGATGWCRVVGCDMHRMLDGDSKAEAAGSDTRQLLRSSRQLQRATSQSLASDPNGTAQVDEEAQQRVETVTTLESLYSLAVNETTHDDRYFRTPEFSHIQSLMSHDALVRNGLVEHIELYPHQQRTVAWMLQREQGISAAKDRLPTHPLWRRLDLSPAGFFRNEAALFYNLYSGALSVLEPDLPPDISGGINGDEMGLGKTLECLSLVLATKGLVAHDGVPSETGEFPESSGNMCYSLTDVKAPASRKENAIGRTVRRSGRVQEKSQKELDAQRSDGSDKVFLSAATLVVVPRTLLTQWVDEIHHQTSPGSLKVSVVSNWGQQGEGSKQQRGGLELAPHEMAQQDLVLTTYDDLAKARLLVFGSGGKRNRAAMTKSRLNSINGNPFSRVHWLRVVLDEAHSVLRSVSSKSAAPTVLCDHVRADRRWCVTGTPVPSKINDLFGLLTFLRHDPFGGSDNSDIFNGCIVKPFELKQLSAYATLRDLFSTLMIRHTKAVIDLPPLSVSLVALRMNATERRAYGERKTAALKVFRNAQLKSWSNEVMREITSLRLLCCVSDQPSAKKTGKGGTFLTEAVSRLSTAMDLVLRDEGTDLEALGLKAFKSHKGTCGICDDLVDVPCVTTVCGYVVSPLPNTRTLPYAQSRVSLFFITMTRVLVACSASIVLTPHLRKQRSPTAWYVFT